MAILTTGSILWPDSRIERIKIDFDAVEIDLVQRNGFAVTVACVGYVAFALDGVWEDFLVADAHLVDSDALVDLAEARARSSQAGQTSGNATRDSARYRKLRVRLECGASLECIAGSFELRPR